VSIINSFVSFRRLQMLFT